MNRNSALAWNRLAVSVAVACTAASPRLLLAQQAADEEATSDELVIVTGSRIQRTSTFDTAVPVTAVTLDQLEAALPGGLVSDQLDQLPQFFFTDSAQQGGGALFGGAGRSTVNLRALGTQRTLVLLDGARIAPADRDGSVHIDNIPSALIQQVEVVTGGASAAYGADALAGVVNFRLNREYTGFNVDVGLGETDDGFGAQETLSLTYGSELGDRWHFVGSLEDRTIDPIDPEPTELGGWFRRYGFVGNPDPSGPARLILPDTHSTRHTPTGRVSTARDASGAVVPFSMGGLNFNFDGTALVPFAPGDVVGTNLTRSQSGGPEAEIANLAFNGAVYGAEVKRRNAFVGLTFDSDEDTRYWINAFLGETESNDINRRGTQHGTTPWSATVFADNPYLPTEVRAAMVAQGVDSFTLEKQGEVLGVTGNMNVLENRRNEFSGWTMQLGLDKQLTDNWALQVRLQRGATDKWTTVLNENRVDRKFLAMDAVEVYSDRRDLDTDGVIDLVAEADRGTGDIICNVQRYTITEQDLIDAVAGVRVPAPQGDYTLGGPGDLVPIPGPVGPNSIEQCVPLNILGQGNVSPEAIAYTESPKAGSSAVTQEFAEVVVTGDIWEGFGPGAFGMAAGVTWREQWFWQEGLPFDEMRYGPPVNAPQIGIRGISPGYTGGSPNLHEFSTVPYIFGRYDVSEVFAEFNLPLLDNGTQRLELDIAGRNSDYSSSGTILSYKSGVNFQATEWLRLRGTKSRDVREPNFAERFNRQGGGGNVDDPMFGGQNFEITTTIGGNPNLKPEEADTRTAGFVFQPTGAPGLQVSVDWYEIDLSGAVAQLTQQAIVDQCFATGNPSVCALIRRDPVTGIIGNVDRINLNLNRAAVRGIDYEFQYNASPNLFDQRDESLSFRLLAGRLLEDSNTVQGGQPDDAANQVGEANTTGLYSVRYQIGDLGVSWRQRYIGETLLNRNWIEGIDVSDNTVASKLYTDLTISWNGEFATGASWRASFDIVNLFDVDPPIIASFSQRFSSQSVNNAYDVYGRRYMLNFSYSL